MPTLERIPHGQLETVVLGAGDLRAAFVPLAGMIGCSLEHRGDELLVQRGGLDAWRGTGRSFGLPLLHPWANRLRDWRYAAAGRAVTIDRSRGVVRADENDLPIHGALAAADDWDVTDAGSDGAAAWLNAALDYGRRDERLAVFPFPHRLELDLRLAADGLTVTTTVEPTGGDAVPLAFGWHPRQPQPRVGDDVHVRGQPESAPAVRVDALETFVELLSRVEADGSSDAFYSSLCEAVCRLTSMDRAVIFRYDEGRRRVRPAGAYGIELDRFTGSPVTVESAPIARQALEEDRVIEMDAEAMRREVPEGFRDLLRDATLVCSPLSAGGRWTGVILADRTPRRPLADEERDLLWTLGKTSALAEAARSATFQQVRLRQLQERIDLAREVHESVIQRLFGVLVVVSTDAPLPWEARERVTAELQAGLRDLRRALQRTLGRSAPETQTTLADEVERLRGAHPDLGIALRPGSEAVGVPAPLEPLAQSVLAEAVRNAHKHASPSRVEVALMRQDGAWVMEVANDGVRERAKPVPSGMGLRLAALEALQVGGLVEFGLREPGTWRVRLAVPHDRP